MKFYLDMTLKDPYESKTIEIKRSNIPGAAEGIFVIKVNNLSSLYDILYNSSFKIFASLGLNKVCKY